MISKWIVCFYSLSQLWGALGINTRITDRIEQFICRKSAPKVKPSISMETTIQQNNTNK